MRVEQTRTNRTRSTMICSICLISRRSQAAGEESLQQNRKSHKGGRNIARAHEQNKLKTQIAGERLTESQTAPAARSSETEQLVHAPSARKSDLPNRTALLRAILFQISPIERTLNFNSLELATWGGIGGGGKFWQHASCASAHITFAAFG